MAKKTIVDIFYLGVATRIEKTTNGLHTYPCPRKGNWNHSKTISGGLTCRFMKNDTKTKELVEQLDATPGLRNELVEIGQRWLVEEIMRRLRWGEQGNGVRPIVPKFLRGKKATEQYTMLITNITSMIAKLSLGKNMWLALDQGHIYKYEDSRMMKGYFEIPVNITTMRYVAASSIQSNILDSFKTAMVEYFNPQVKVRQDKPTVVIETEYFNFTIDEDGRSLPTSIDTTGMMRRRTPCARFVICTSGDIVSALETVRGAHNKGHDLEKSQMALFAHNFLKEDFKRYIKHDSILAYCEKFQRYSTSWSVSYFCKDYGMFLDCNLNVKADDVSNYSQKDGDCIINFGGVPDQANDDARSFVENALFRNYIVKHLPGNYQRAEPTALGGEMKPTRNISEVTHELSKLITGRSNMDKESIAANPHTVLTSMQRQQEQLRHGAHSPLYSSTGSMDMNRQLLSTQRQSLTSACRTAMANNQVHAAQQFADTASEDKCVFFNTHVGIIKGTKKGNVTNFEFAKTNECYAGVQTMFQIFQQARMSSSEMNDVASVLHRGDVQFNIMSGAIRKYLETDPALREACHIDRQVVEMLNPLATYWSPVSDWSYYLLGHEFKIGAGYGYHVDVAENHLCTVNTEFADVKLQAVRDAMFGFLIYPECEKIFGKKVAVRYKGELYGVKEEDGVWVARSVYSDTPMHERNFGEFNLVGGDNQWETKYYEMVFGRNGDVIMQTVKELHESKTNPLKEMEKIEMNGEGRDDRKLGKSMADKCGEIVELCADLYNANENSIIGGMRLQRELLARDISMAAYMDYILSDEGIGKIAEVAAKHGIDQLAEKRDGDIVTKDDTVYQANAEFAVQEKPADHNISLDVAFADDEEESMYINYYAQLVAEHVYQNETMVSVACAIPEEMRTDTYTTIYGVKPNGESVAIADVREDSLVDTMLESLLATL